MLTREENELVTHTGPGTPCGELFRRYWHPVAAASELTPERPKKRVKVLGEELVLFRAEEGPGARGRGTDASQEQLPAPNPRSPTPVRYGLVGEQCSHRGASLYYGFLEDGCIRCPYHGWMYDKQGNCVEQPFEPQQSLMRYTIRHPAYPVQKLGGLLFTYMGPREKQPLLPRWDLLVRADGTRDIEIRPTLHCNWLQAEENSADSTHVYFLHTYYDAKARGLRPGEDFDQRPLEHYGFQRFEWGLMKSLTFGGEHPQLVYDRPVIFPNMLRIRDEMHWRVPIDDTTTRIFWIRFVPSRDGSIVEETSDPPVRYAPPWQNAEGEYLMDIAQSQDGMAWETQGAIYDRTKEHLGSSDHGVTLFREMLFEQIQVVQEGGDPIALVWDAAKNEVIDLWAQYLGVRGDVPLAAAGGRGRRGPAEGERWGSNFTRGVDFERVFDETHKVFEVPFGAARPVRG